jgi:phage terminase small subunit
MLSSARNCTAPGSVVKAGMAEKKLTAKQEAFAVAFFETGNAAEAYRQSYDVDPNCRDTWIRVEACQLLDNPNITLRIQELQEHAARHAIYTRVKALEEYEEARQDAKTLGNPSAAVAAIKGKVALLGLEAPAKSRVDHTSSDGSMTPKPAITLEMTPEQAAEAYAAAINPPAG